MTIKRESDNQLILVEIKGRPNILEIQRKLIDAVELIRTENLKYAILDTREMEVLFTLSLYWYRMYWLPLAKTCGLKDLAVILPKSFTSLSHLDRLNETGEKLEYIQFNFFTEFAEARAWIASLD